MRRESGFQSLEISLSLVHNCLQFSPALLNLRHLRFSYDGFQVADVAILRLFKTGLGAFH